MAKKTNADNILEKKKSKQKEEENPNHQTAASAELALDDREKDTKLEKNKTKKKLAKKKLESEDPEPETLAEKVKNMKLKKKAIEQDEDGGVQEESDSSEDEVEPRNTIGDVPLWFYKDEDHIGHDREGRKIKKPPERDSLARLIENADDPKSWRIIYDEVNGEYVRVSKKESNFIRNLISQRTPAGVDPYPDYVDFIEKEGHPLSNAPEPKRRFLPSKWESKEVVRLIRAIRNGHIKLDKPTEESRLYLLWGDDSSSTANAGHGLHYVPPPKPKLAGHEESYNPSVEFIPTQEEVNAYELMFEEDRPKFIPRGFEHLRKVPAYDKALKELFDRCLDLYLCPRKQKKRLNIDPESLKPKLPSRKDLKPYPTTCFLEFRGHKGAVTSISVDLSGEWLASGSTDGTVRLWEVHTGRCRKVWEVDEAVNHVAWNPMLPMLAVSLGQDVLILNTGLGNEEEQEKIGQLLHVEAPAALESSGKSTPIVNWLQHDKYEGIILKHIKTVSSVEWHRRGDYFTTVMPGGDSRAILMHHLSKRTTKTGFKLRGLPVSSVFHSSRSYLFVATKKTVVVHDLLKGKNMKKLEPGVREVSSISIHSGGDNVIVGSRDGKLCWFDMDLSTEPYKKLKCHSKDITKVAFHRSYPLFASCSDDSTAHIFHGMVYSDLNENPLIVPVEVLRGHTSTNGRGVLDCVFHPRNPWLFTAGADSLIKLYVNT